MVIDSTGVQLGDMKTPKKVRVGMAGIIYIRVSSDEQTKGTSLDEQLEACEKYCVDNNIKLLKVFREEGVSAKNINREQFLDAVEFCRKKDVDAFIVWKCDRFARNLQDHYAVKSTLVKYGTKLHSVTEKFTDDATGKLLEGMMAVIAEFDNDIRKQRCSGGMLGRLKKGIWPWRSPVGYACVHNKKQDKKKELADPIDPINFSILQQALKKLTKKPFTLLEFAQTLNDEGLVTSRSGLVNIKLADRILTDNLSFYAGKLKNPFYPESGDESYNGAHQQMITEEEMLAIQKNRTYRNIKEKVEESVITQTEKYNENYPLKGLLLCNECGCKVTGSSSRGNGGIFHYYHCFNGECPRKGKVISKKSVETQFISCLKQITPKKEFLELFRERIINSWNEKGRRLDLDIKYYKADISEIKQERNVIVSSHYQGIIPRAQYYDSIEHINNKEMVTKISLHEAKIDWFDIETTVIYATTFISNLSRTWFDLPRDMRPQFQKLIFPNGIFLDTNKTLRTDKIGCIYELIDSVALTETCNRGIVDPSGFEPLASGVQNQCSTK